LSSFCMMSSMSGKHACIYMHTRATDVKGKLSLQTHGGEAAGGGVWAVKLDVLLSLLVLRRA
jgi:hypothetical protein